MVFVFGVIIAASCIISFIIVAQVLALANKKSWYDPIDDRKIHTGEVPRLGGIGFASAFIGISFGITVIIPLLPVQILPGSSLHLPFLFPLIAMLLIFVFGVFDDFRPMAARYKLLIQVIAAFLVLIPGYSFRGILFVDFGILGTLIWLRYPLTFLWIVGLTNAVNLIDGVDGLAGGISALAAVFFALIFAFIAHNSAMALICLCLAASLVGFLIFNMPFPRARIFMGDGGSQFLGFILALIPLMYTYGRSADLGPSSFPLLYAAALLAIPIFDTFAAIWRRLRDGRRIHKPDRLHIHHKLLNLGLSARGVDAVLYSLQVILGVLVFESLRFRGTRSLIFLGAAYMAVTGFFVTIHYMNRAVLRKRKAPSA
ncbi:undecaprenyl-phosphate alpha-N-acetylglucosaminyl 1-phosphate transferase [Spirochaetia bacterium]|nr:undecaprenyl-phosphate alpha-N-acetylglucosaminyl 1-phosphate transferase [Spirochaetia bacterium]